MATDNILGSRVDDTVAQQAILRRILEGHLALPRHRLLGRQRRQLAEAGAASGRPMHHLPGLGGQLLPGQLPARSRRAQQHFPGRRAHGAQFVPAVAHRQGATGKLGAVTLGIHRCGDHLNRGPVRVQFFGNNHR